MKKLKRASNAPELRQLAEQRLQERVDTGEAIPASVNDVSRLVQELQVHQTELELQNEELKAARDELEAGLQRYAELYDFAPVGYLTLGRDGGIRKANLAGARLLGMERSRLIGRRLGLSVADSSRADFDAFLRRTFDSKAKEVCELELRAVDREPLAVRIEAALSEDGEECRAMLLDITERRRGEQALREMDRRRNDFLAVLSHELRNPLSPILNSLYILELAPAGSDRSRRAQEVIRRQTGQLARLVDDLLDVTRITRNKIQLQRERLELNVLVRGVVEDHLPQFENSEVSLELKPAPAPVYVLADGNRLAQVIGNLLQNASKFAGRNGSARVSVSTDAGERRAVVRIADSGVGLAPAMLSRLFEPFSQADSSLDRSKGGLGLGLALVKGIVDLHGGEVSVHSAGLGKGAEFTIKLPLDLAGKAKTPALRPAVARSPWRILIIEDNIDAADTMKEVLEFGEHQVAVAYTGPQGLKSAREFSPDLVLCDIGLPGMDGYEVAHAIRNDDSLKHAYLVAVTGYALPDDLQRATSAGFDRHLAKPVSIERLEEVLASLRPR
ncbi:MAG: response regulator [Deltaproteobacteria bacterium]|nr:response regulator [Deltaproteobacteria bacterium]